MKRVLKVVGLGLAALVALLVLVGLFLPRQWHVERTVVINAPPEHIHPLVSDLRAWQLWSAWNNAMDPDVKHTYGGPESGVGAWWAWQGPKMGKGRMTITRSEQGAGVWVDESIEGEEVNAHGAVTWAAEGSGTRVRWVDDGTLPPVMGGYFVGFINGMLGAHFETGLTHLKAEAEKRRASAEALKAAPPAADNAQAAPAVP